MIATCHTEGCGNAGEAIDVGELTWTDEDGTEYTSAVICGVCGQPITDVGGG
jgi:hypothetical protein